MRRYQAAIAGAVVLWLAKAVFGGGPSSTPAAPSGSARLAPPAAGSSPAPTAPPIAPLQVIVLDVGHGDCIWIKTPDDGIRGNGMCEGYNIIIDGGPSSKRIMPLLTEVGFRYGTPVEFMFCTHAHNDHYRGLISILQNSQVKRVFDPGYRSNSEAYGAFCWNVVVEPGCSFYSPAVGISAVPALKSFSPTVPCSLDWGGELEATILHSNPAVTEDSINLSSIVLKVTYGEVSFLFTGDGEGKYRPDASGRNDLEHPRFVEKFLLERYGATGLLKSTILKIPHHGSETSGTAPFIRAVSPKEGIICAGNRYGLPDASVVRRYEDAGCRVWSTDRLDRGKPPAECHGDDHVVITTDGKGYRIRYLKPDPLESNQPSANAVK